MSEKISRIVVEYGKNRSKICYESGDCFVNYLELINFEDDAIIEFHLDNGEVSKIQYGIFKKYGNGDILSEVEKEQIADLEEGKFTPKITFTDKPVPEMEFFDITETELFDYHPINEGVLNDKEQGIWANYGLRKFKFGFENLDVEIVKKPSFSAGIAFVKKDNEKLENAIIAKDGVIRNKLIEDDIEMYSYIDTNDFGKEFTDNSQYMKFFGALEISSFEKEELKVTYIFPMEIIMHNTNYNLEDKKNPCALLSKKAVSIDFGTSSSCVAVDNDGRIELLTLSSEKKIDEVNIFENPTNLMIYNWEKIYAQWKNENEDFPLMHKGTIDEYKYEDVDVEFDVGYTVSDVLEEAETVELNAILTEIKLIVYALEQGDDLKVFPLIKSGTEVIKLVSSPEEQDECSLDPIAFYGYLLGRAINNPAEAKIYTKFEITYPVKFNGNVRAKLKKSLEYGLKRAIPKNLRDAVDAKNNPVFRVEMKYPEPVAYIGAICGNHLTATYENPELFAVYDFGGGTLDSSFGMFRVDEEEEPIIEIFGVDGDERIGGESLIAQLSYWIYEDNIDAMKENGIPFVKPQQEQIPNDFPSRLLNRSNIAKSNLRKIDEMFSRKLFKNLIGEDTQAETIEIPLLNEHNDPVEISIAVDYSILKGKLSEMIEKTIVSFKESVLANFNRKSDILAEHKINFDISKVKIYKSGNASRNKLVEELMKEHFSENEIFLIDEDADGTNNKKYAITPKTAVAFGQLRLSNFDVIGCDETPFKWNIYKENKGDGSFKQILGKNCEHKNWVSYGVIRGEEVEIYYSNIMAKTREDEHFSVRVETDNDGKGYLFIRMNDETSIEYIICEGKNETPDDNLGVNQNNIVIIE